MYSILDTKSKVYYTLIVKHTIHLNSFLKNMTGSDLLKNIIQELRKEKKITQSELADAVDVTRQTIISLENGKYKASLVLAHKIAQYFNMNIEDIFIFDLEEENICY